MKKYLIIFILFFVLINCNKKIDIKSKNTIKSIVETNKKKDTIIDKQLGIYIGKKFYEGDELSEFDYYKGGFLSKDSLLTFSIYVNKYIYIYSVENQISYEDVREYLIVDTLMLNKKQINNLKTFSYPLSEKNRIISFLKNNKKKNVFISLTSKKIIKDSL